MTSDNTMAVRLFIEICINITFVVVMTGIFVYIFINSKRTRVQIYYCCMHILVLTIFILNFAISIAPNIRVKWILFYLLYLIKPFFETSFMFYALYFFKRRILKKIGYIVVTIYIITSILIIISNSAHQLVIKHMTPEIIEYGWLYYVVIAAGYCMLVAGLLSIAKTMAGRVSNLWIRVIITVFAIITMGLLNLLLCGVVNTPVDYSPIILIVNFTMIFIGSYKYGMIDTVSYGSVRGFEMFTEAMLIADKKGKIEYRNKACEMIEPEVLDEILRRAIPEAQTNSVSREENRFEIEINHNGILKHFSVSVKYERTLTLSAKQYIIVVHDNSRIFSAIHSLEEKNQYLEDMHESVKMLSEDTKRLSILGERNMMAKEIHDVMGHSLILAINIMESNRVLIETSQDDQKRQACVLALKRLQNAIDEIDGSLSEIAAVSDEDSISDDKSGVLMCNPGYTNFIERMNSMAFNLMDTGITLDIAGLDEALKECNEKTITTIYRICQESVTNAIKHGQAQCITVSARVKSGQITLIIVDNGKGNPEFQKGSGLTGMEERVASLGGNINFCSFEDERGFLVHVNIPWPL